MLRGIVCALALLAPALAWADGPPAAQPEDGKVTWPLPWRAGVALEYDQSFESVDRKGDVAVAMKGSDVVRISIERADTGGFVQRWVSTDPKLDGEHLPAELRTVMTSTLQAFKGLALDVRLDREGGYQGLLNLAELQPRFRDAMLAIMTRTLSLDGKPPRPEDTAMMTRMVDTITAPAVVQNQLAEEPAAYNFVAGGGLALDAEYEYEDEGANPLGGKPIRMVNTMSLRQADDPDQYELHWRVVPDAAQTTAMVEQFVRDMFKDQKDMPASAIEKALAGLSRDAEFSTSVTYLIDKASGIVERMESVQVKRFGSKNETERTVMTLRR